MAEKQPAEPKQKRRQPKAPGIPLTERLYRFTYLIGSQTIRLGRRLKKRILRLARWCGTSLVHAAQRAGRGIRHLWVAQRLRIKRSYSEIRRGLRELREDYRASRHLSREEKRARLKESVSNFFLQFHRHIHTLLHYFAPLLGLVILLGTVFYVRSLNFALGIGFDGQIIAYVENESVYEQARAMVEDRIIRDLSAEQVHLTPERSMAIVKKEDLTDAEELANLLMQRSGGELSEADGFYVGDDFIGAVEDGDELLIYLDSILEEYRTGEPGERVTFDKPISVVEGLYPSASIVDIAAVRNVLNTEEQEQRTYIVQEGDSPLLISDKLEVPYSVLKSLNPGIETSLLIGDELIVSRAVPYLSVLVTRTVVEEQSIPFEIEQTVDSSQNRGWSEITQTGEAGLEELTYEITYEDGVEIERKLISTRTIKEMVPQKITVGGNTPLVSYPTVSGGTNVGGFIWPVGGDGGYVSAGLYGYYGHTGMDIATTIGTPIYAAASGQVVLAKWSAYYGYNILIDHGGGVQTRYAHCSALYVQVGQYVEQGTPIAAVGATGNVTGPHCHFEVKVNGQFMNPANYVGTRTRAQMMAARAAGY